jgi:hemolysin activation/secretion protein
MFLTVLLCLTGLCFAETEVEAKKSELEKALEQLRESLEEKAPLGELTFPEDTSPRFLVRELRIRGNNLISTATLLRNLPVVYTVSVQKDGRLVEESYDFRVISEILLNPGPSREVSLWTIQGFTKYVLSIYQRHGYGGIYVYVPAERVEGAARLEDEVLIIKVLEGKLAEVVIDRYDFDRKKQEKGFLKDSVLISWSPAKVGETIRKKKLDDFLGLLNLNPDRYISAVISRSADPNALKLGYDIYESNPWHWYLQVDNSGTEDRQWSPRIGLVNTNLTGIDDRFSAMYQAPWDKNIDEDYSVFGSYNLPVFTPRLRLNVYAGYSQFDIPSAGISFIGNGSFFGSVLSYNIAQIAGWFIDVTGSVSLERSKVTPSLGIASDVDMDLWGAGVNIHRSDGLADTSFVLNRSESMGGSSQNRFEQARLGADRDFTIYTFAAAHSRYLDSDKVNRLSGSLRYTDSDERLIPAKMTTFGGLYTVRGYEEDEIVADGGLLVSGQYEFDLVKYRQPKGTRANRSNEMPAKKLQLTKLAPLAFIDYGRAKIKDPIPGEDEVQKVCSVGTGVMAELSNDISGSIYYGWPLRETNETDRCDGRFNFVFIYRF